MCSSDLGKAAATRPDSTLQADLIDFSNNLPPTAKGNRYAVVLSDVFTRELRTAAVPSKDPRSEEHTSELQSHTTILVPTG